MTETDRPSFFHTTEFNAWLITSFFTVLASLCFAILPVAGIHALGVEAGEELSRYGAPASEKTPGAPRIEPVPRPMHGFPVALGSARRSP